MAAIAPSLIGVMGAGLLIFVRNDLMAVVEVNQGQKAFDVADARVQAAKRQLLSDATRQHYTRDNSNDCTAGNRATQEDWSPSITVFANSKDCSGGTTTRSTGGIAKDFVVDGRVEGRFTVEIQCLEQLNDPADSTDPCKGISESAPESVEASQNTFFKIISTGYYPASGSGATRKIEAIYNTEDLDVPKG